MKRVKVGIVDTMFARIDMAALAIDEIDRHFAGSTKIFRSTVPGIKDIAAGVAILDKNEKCDVYLALGMVGRAPIDTQCAHEASLGIQMCRLLLKKHIVEAFVHEFEAKDEADLYFIAEGRTRKHAANAVLLAVNPSELSKFAGMGKRQGRQDAGSIAAPKKG